MPADPPSRRRSARPGRAEAADKLLAGLADAGSAQDRPWAYLNWGLLSLNRDGDFATAERRERMALQLDPDLVMAHDSLAGQEMHLGHDQSAIAHLQIENRLLATAPTRQLTRAIQSILRAWSKARLAEELGDFGAVVRAAHQAQLLRDYQGIVQTALFTEAGALARLHDVSGSRRLLADGGWPAATSSFETSFGWNSNLLPEVCQDQGLEDWPAMRRDLLAAQTRAAGAVWSQVALHTYVWPWLAWASAQAGDRAEAESLIAATPLDCYLCLRVRGRLAALGGDWGGGAAWFARATRLAPSPPFAWLEWGRMLAAKGDQKAAAALFTAAHDKQPNFADPLEAWGESLAMAREPQAAIGKFEAAAALAPRWGRLHLAWGDALGALGRRDEAMKHYRTAAGLDLAAPDAALVARRLAGGART